MVSALTMLELDEMMARYASYEDLAEIIRQRFTNPDATLHELFGRIVFNILCGNTDDHARNHAAFWNGTHLTLTPAYDICPQSRAGNEASQAMKIHGDNNLSQLKVCIASAASYKLTVKQAQEIIDQQLQSPADLDREASPSDADKADPDLFEYGDGQRPQSNEDDETSLPGAQGSGCGIAGVQGAGAAAWVLLGLTLGLARRRRGV